MSDIPTVEIPGSITAPRGFLAAGVHCGIKKAKKDLALIVSTHPTKAAAVFTTNKVKAAPVVLCAERLRAGSIRAILVNSGNANSCTGERGYEDAVQSAELAAQALDVAPGEVLVASTGVIGVPLPMEQITAGIPGVVSSLSREGGHDAACAILTTDTFAKEIAVKVDIGGKSVTIAGIAKGSGMIHPNMATMLAFITTDAAVSPPLLRQALRRGTDKSFNMITVDGDTSTNDMAVILANGLAGNPVIAAEDAGYAAFSQALEHVMIRLAKMIVKDGEGASKVVAVTVKGAADQKDARAAAMSIANSNLVKTAVFGSDANWGRIIAAVGYSEARFQPNAVDIFIGDVQTTSNGHGVPFNEECVREFLGREEVAITVDLKAGPAAATVWTCDLTYEYVRINGSYRT